MENQLTWKNGLATSLAESISLNKTEKLCIIDFLINNKISEAQTSTLYDIFNNEQNKVTRNN